MNKTGVRSVHGTISIAESDPGLKRADAVLRRRFNASLRPGPRKTAARTGRKA